jgi:hypothetical protein
MSKATQQIKNQQPGLLSFKLNQVADHSTKLNAMVKSHNKRL